MIIKQSLFKQQFVQFPGSHLPIMTEDVAASGDVPWGAFLKSPTPGCLGSSKIASPGGWLSALDSYRAVGEARSNPNHSFSAPRETT